MIRPPPFEDELGDVLEKALKVARLDEQELARRTGIDVNRIKDAFGYRYEFTSVELEQLAAALSLNEAGLRALAEGRYPEAADEPLPFRLRVISMPYGVGVVNAFVAAECGADSGVLIDSGSCPNALLAAWPDDVRAVHAHFVTHWDSDHTGGCQEIIRRFGLPYCMGPGPKRNDVRILKDGEILTIDSFRIQVLSTPGPARDHFCYLLSHLAHASSPGVLFSGDLFFCGSVGGGFHDSSAVVDHCRRLWRDLPGDTLVAPGHGPLTTIDTERELNPFSEAP